MTVTAKKRHESFVDGNTLKLENVQIRYPKLFKPDTGNDDPSRGMVFSIAPQWNAHIIVKDPGVAKALASYGVNMKDSDDGPWFKVTRKCETGKGQAMAPPTVTNAEGLTWDPNTIIGNGSTVTVTLKGMYSNPREKNHLVTYLNEVQVTDLVPYEGADAGVVLGA